MKFSLLLAMATVAAGISGARGEAVLRNGDIFCLRLRGTPVELAKIFSLEYAVGNEGTVSIPHISAPIKASGLTTAALERGIEKQLVEAKIFMQPTVEITNCPCSRCVTVGGAVRSPGTVEWFPELTLSTAIKRSGGVSFGGYKCRVTRDGKTTIYDLKRYLRDPRNFSEQNPRLLPGDEVEVPE